MYLAYRFCLIFKVKALAARHGTELTVGSLKQRNLEGTEIKDNSAVKKLFLFISHPHIIFPFFYAGGRRRWGGGGGGGVSKQN